MRPRPSKMRGLRGARGVRGTDDRVLIGLCCVHLLAIISPSSVALYLHSPQLSSFPPTTSRSSSFVARSHGGELSGVEVLCSLLGPR